VNIKMVVGEVCFKDVNYAEMTTEQLRWRSLILSLLKLRFLLTELIV
jgi:hypothetical protein